MKCDSCWRRSWRPALALAAIATFAVAPPPAGAQTNGLPPHSASPSGPIGPNGLPTPPPGAPNAAPPPAAGEEADNPQGQPAPIHLLSSAELKKLLAPIALYPDPLLAQILSASAFPLQIVLAERWLNRNEAAVAKHDFAAVDSQWWDASVKALARFPAIVKRMSEDLDRTIALGEAEKNQPQDVAAAIQELRAEAQKAGTLGTTTEQTVTTSYVGGEPSIAIEPAEPFMIYAPNYDWAAAYETAEPLVFGEGVAVGAWWTYNYWRWCNWRNGAIYVWAGRPGTHPPGPRWRPGRPACVGRDCGAVNANIDADLKLWRPNGDVRGRLGNGSQLGLGSPGATSAVRPLGAESAAAPAGSVVGAGSLGAEGAAGPGRYRFGTGRRGFGAQGVARPGFGAAPNAASPSTFASASRFAPRPAPPIGQFAPRSLNFGPPLLGSQPLGHIGSLASPHLGHFMPPARLAPALPQPGRLAPAPSMPLTGSAPPLR